VSARPSPQEEESNHGVGERADGTGTSHPRGTCRSLQVLQDQQQAVPGGEAPQTRVQQPAEIDEALTSPTAAA
jgi:hypothetical protein